MASHDTPPEHEPPGSDSTDSPTLPVPAADTDDEPDPDGEPDADQQTDTAPSPRTYLHIRPTDTPLDPRTVTHGFKELHQLGQATSTRRWHHRLLRSRPTPPTIEWLLVSGGGDDPTIDYYVGIDDPDRLDGLERILRGLFPDDYEFGRVDRHPDALGFTNTTRPQADEPVAAVTLQGVAERRTDWQTQLTSFDAFDADDAAAASAIPRIPLSHAVETMADASVPMVYQTLVHPLSDWSVTAHARQASLEKGEGSIVDAILDAVLGEPERRVDSSTTNVGPAAAYRIEELDAKDARRSFVVNTRVVALAPEPNADGDVRNAADVETGNSPTATTDPAANVIRDLATAFAPVGHTCYDIEGSVSTGTAARHVLDAVRERRVHPPDYERLVTRLPWTHNTSPGIVADPTEAPNFCLLDGAALTTAARRALSPTPGERTVLARPPSDLLPAYLGSGMPLGTPLTQDDTPAPDPVVVPPSLQPLHSVWFGKTGSGKTTALINAIHANHAATDGADVLIDPKGDGMATEYLRAHYARFGSLDDVLYFNCAEVLPAFSFFDVRDELAAGIPRTTAVEDAVDHYVEILTGIMGRDRFEQAVRSPDVIRYLVKAMFDPVNGGDAFAHRELHEAARQMHERQSAPAVSDPDLERMLGGVVANRARTFDEIMAGVANRLEKIPVDQRLARIFNHVPERESDDPHFDLVQYLNDDVVIVVDTGELRSEAQRVLALVILSILWTALKRRKRREPGREHPLVNLYVEEAASIAVSELLTELLGQSRGFGLSVTLSMQFPAQLREADERTYREVLNNVSTFVIGNVPFDHHLAKRLATDDMEPGTVGNRLRALRRGQWLVKLPAAFDNPEPRPFLVGSLPLPPGDPAGDRPLTAEYRRAFDEAVGRVRERTLETSGLTLGTPSAAAANEEPEEETAGEAAATAVRVDSALPHTKRMPPTVEYKGSLHALQCRECGNRYDPSAGGMRRAINCCHSLAEVDRDDVPIADLNLKLTMGERAAREWSDEQLMFLQAVYNAQQLRYEPLEYDLLRDSMLRLQEYVRIDSDGVQDLIDADLLRHDTDHPHRLYTVTPEGRKPIGESYREGVDYGHGQGDLEESSEHVFAVEVGRQYLEQEYVADRESPVVEVVPYYDIDEQRRLDIAGVDAEGEIVVAVEAERVNHDVLQAVPEDFDKIADCDVDEAIWIVMKQADGHKVLSALNDPPDGGPRVGKTYARTTPPQQFRIDTPGMTAMYPAEWLRDQIDRR